MSKPAVTEVSGKTLLRLQSLKRMCAYSLQVDLTRTFTFRNSKQTYTGIPIIVANMDTVGTFEMAVVMAKVSFDSHLCNNWETTG